MCPKIGIERVHLRGRLSVLLGPLTNVIPLIGAAQVAFINPPELTLDFTDAADIADCFLISKIVRKTIIEIVGGMAVLPNRFLVKLDNANDFFKTYVPYHGVLRVTVEKATGVTGPKKNGAKGLLAKIVKDVPDCYCKVKVGTTTEWRTTTKKNNYEPAWNETHDFLVSDYEQAIELNVQDDDIGGDDDVGVGSISVKDILLGGGTKEIALTHNGEHTDGRLTVHAKFLNLVNNTSSLDEGAEDDQFVGLATVLVASALNLQGQHEELRPSVKVSWAGKNFRTAILKYAPGSDIFNPAFDQAFTIPITKSMVENPEQFKIALLDKEEETGSAEVPFEQVRNAEYATVAEAYDVGSGSSVRVSISLRGLEFAE
ncbi:hypothetical protein P280DRAFT_470008 [Massarina eburnea CBS 473.64]|uniref:C2 domain-containing protein n=1 Tax=Massarina eburnea CBS 473.64 TaxID=1395130 RepID=A0A6A6RZE7_9PLEO|nr:hypothetical protein P280DRAFT_470008 [Massarina eburnea CBS 473.64]